MVVPRMRGRRLGLSASSALLTVLLTSCASVPGPPGGPDSEVDPTTSSKFDAPMNVNPDKSPVLDPPPYSAEPEPSLSIEEQLQHALAVAASDPGSTVICLSADGSVAGLVFADAVDPGVGISDPVAAAMCGRSFPESHPYK